MSETLMTDAATNTEGAPTSSDAAPADAQAQANADAGAAQQQQATDGKTPTTETTSQDGQTDGKQAAQDETKASAPEKYEFQTPDGVVVDDSSIEAFSEIAKELDMPQEAAQKILDKMAPILAQQQVAVLDGLSQSWIEGVRADKEIGGDKLQENLAVAKKAIDTFGTPELRQLLNDSKLGNHPEVIRAFYRAGKAISEDSKVVSGDAARPGGMRDLSKALYPNQQT
jgi:hypothetical protein